MIIEQIHLPAGLGASATTVSSVARYFERSANSVELPADVDCPEENSACSLSDNAVIIMIGSSTAVRLMAKKITYIK